MVKHTPKKWKQIYVKIGIVKELKNIGDILDNNGYFYTFGTLKEICQVRGTF